MLSIRATLIVITLEAMLAGCIAVPYPYVNLQDRYEIFSRQNLGDRVPTFIVPGQTTREALLLQLGDPDGVAQDESWFAYGSALRKKGPELGFAGGVPYGKTVAATRGTVRYRRLLVRFGAAGTVTGTDMQEKECTAWHTPEGHSEFFPPDCLAMSGADAESEVSSKPHVTTSIETAKQLIPGDEKVKEVFEGMMWVPDLALTAWGDAFGRVFRLEDAPFGTWVILSDKSLTLSARASQDVQHRRIAFANITKVEVTLSGQAVVVTQSNGHTDSFMARHGDEKRIKVVADSLRAGIEAVKQ